MNQYKLIKSKSAINYSLKIEIAITISIEPVHCSLFVNEFRVSCKTLYRCVISHDYYLIVNSMQFAVYRCAELTLALAYNLLKANVPLTAYAERALKIAVA